MKKSFIIFLLLLTFVGLFAQKNTTIEKYKEVAGYIQSGDFEQVKIYVNTGYSIKPPSGFLFSILTVAIFTEQLTIAQYLIDNGADVNYENGSGNDKTSVLGYALNLDTPTEAVKLLLKNGANPNYKESSGFYMLDKAFGSKNNTVISLLINAGANVNNKTYIEGITYSSLCLLLSLHYDYTAVKLMLDAGAELNSKIYYSTKSITLSVLDFAEYIDDSSDIVKLLKSKGANNYYKASSTSSTKYLSLNNIFSYIGNSNRTAESSSKSGSYNSNKYQNLEIVGFYLNKTNYCNGDCDRYIISFNKEINNSGTWNIKKNQIYVYKKHNGEWYSSSSNFMNTTYIAHDKNEVMKWALKKYSK